MIAQGTGQAPLEAAQINKDIFVTEPIGAEIALERDAGGKVIALRSIRADRSCGNSVIEGGTGSPGTIAAGTVQALRLTYQLRSNRPVSDNRSNDGRSWYEA